MILKHFSSIAPNPSSLSFLWVTQSGFLCRGFQGNAEKIILKKLRQINTKNKDKKKVEFLGAAKDFWQGLTFYYLSAAIRNVVSVIFPFLPPTSFQPFLLKKTPIKLLRASFTLSLFGDLLFYPSVWITPQESVLLTGFLQPDDTYLESGKHSCIFSSCLQNVFYLILFIWFLFCF